MSVKIPLPNQMQNLNQFITIELHEVVSQGQCAAERAQEIMAQQAERIEELREALKDIEMWSDYALWNSNTDKDRKAMMESINKKVEDILKTKEVIEKENLK